MIKILVLFIYRLSDVQVFFLFSKEGKDVPTMSSSMVLVLHEKVSSSLTEGFPMRSLWILAFAALMAGGCRRSSTEDGQRRRPSSTLTVHVRDAGPSARRDVDAAAAEARAALMARLQRAIDQPIEEPTGLPAFRIYRGVNGLDAAPTTSSCRWVTLPADRWQRETKYVPSSFLEGGEFHYVRRDFARCGFPAETSWANVLKRALVQLVRAPRMHEDFLSHAAFAPGEGDGHLQVLAAYGLLQTDFVDEGGGETWYDFRAGALQALYRSEPLLDRVFNWAAPHVARVWSILPSADRGSYLQIVRHAKTYLETFDEAAEVTYLRRLEEGTCEHPRTDASSMRWFRSLARPGYPASSCTHEFTNRGPDGHETPYRKVEAWVFRRVHDGMPRARLATYLDRVITLFER